MTVSVYHLTGPRALELREEPLGGGLLTPAEIEAVTVYTAISPGTELAAWEGKPPLRPSSPYPRLLGYCNLACVTRVGSEVAGMGEGDYVLTQQSHRSAFRAQANEVLVAVRSLSDRVLRALTTTYLYHLGYAALLQAGYVPGHAVAVVGLGALGFTTASLVKVTGGDPTVFSGRAGSLPMPEGMRILPKTLPLVNEISPIADLGGFDLVVNTSDSWADYFFCLEVVRRGGTVVLLSFPGRGRPLGDVNPLDSRFLYDKQLTIRQVGQVPQCDVPAADVRFTLKRNLRYLAGLIEDGRLDAAPLVKLSGASSELAQLYQRLASRPPGMYSALLEWMA